jgi:Fe-S-cluster containining protein
VVAGCGTSSELLKRVGEIYDWLDVQVRRSSDLAGVCTSCGNCCDFDGFDHRLFVTSPELAYFAASLGEENTKPMLSSRCPYNIEGKCNVYEYRFAGCRIFCCSANADLQSRLSESTLEKLKSVCTELHIPYRYTDLAAALNGLAGV